MRHLDEAMLLALRDGEAAEGREAAERHLAECETCRNALAEVGSRREAIAQALAGLDEPIDVPSAREAVRARLGGHGHARGAVVLRSLRRAAVAALFLGAAGAAYAMPGSPLRAWLSHLGGEGAPAQTPSAPAAATQSRMAETGVHIDVGAGPVTIVLDGARAGTEIRVTLVSGTTAAVTATRGTHFTTAAGRIEAVVAPGIVRVRLPRDARPASIEVSGRVYLRGTGVALDVLGPTTERTDSVIRFEVPAR